MSLQDTICVLKTGFEEGLEIIYMEFSIFNIVFCPKLG